MENGTKIQIKEDEYEVTTKTTTTYTFTKIQKPIIVEVDSENNMTCSCLNTYYGCVCKHKKAVKSLMARKTLGLPAEKTIEIKEEETNGKSNGEHLFVDRADVAV